jgi:hypothetical protein
MNWTVIAYPGKLAVVKNVDGTRFQATFARMAPFERRYTRGAGSGKNLEGGRDVTALCEKELDPRRAQTIGLLQEFAHEPSAALENRICQQLSAGRAWISTNVLGGLQSHQVALIDRWYPSDAAFRRTTPFSRVLEMNHLAGVREPLQRIRVAMSNERHTRLQENFRRVSVRHAKGELRQKLAEQRNARFEGYSFTPSDDHWQLSRDVRVVLTWIPWPPDGGRIAELAGKPKFR